LYFIPDFPRQQKVCKKLYGCFSAGMTPSQKDALTKRIARIVQRGGGASAVARRLGVTPPAVRAWTLGSTPYHQNLAALCEEFGVNLDWLLHGRGEEEADAPAPSNTFKESPPDSHGESKAQRLSAMIHELDITPHSFLPLAIARVRELFEEYMHTMQNRVNGHGPAPVNYGSRKRNKRTP
jgi:transcriptional regulator with XRE-family HTH domain